MVITYHKLPNKSPKNIKMATFTNEKYGDICRQHIKKAKTGNTLVSKVMYRISPSQQYFMGLRHTSIV